MKRWVKILLAIFIGVMIVIAIIGLAFPEHLPTLRETLSSFFGGVISGLHGFFHNIWLSIEPVVMPNLFLFFVISLFLAGIFGMYFGHKITTRMQNFIGVQWRRQTSTATGGAIPMTIGGSTDLQNQLASATPSATALLGATEPPKEE